MKNYVFDLQLQALGDTPEEAWANAVEAFTMDPGDTPEDFETEDVVDE